jgi:hypothetical protein
MLDYRSCMLGELRFLGDHKHKHREHLVVIEISKTHICVPSPATSEVVSMSPVNACDILWAMVDPSRGYNKSVSRTIRSFVGDEDEKRYYGIFQILNCPLKSVSVACYRRRHLLRRWMSVDLQDLFPRKLQAKNMSFNMLRFYWWC